MVSLLTPPSLPSVQAYEEAHYVTYLNCVMFHMAAVIESLQAALSQARSQLDIESPLLTHPLTSEEIQNITCIHDIYTALITNSQIIEMHKALHPSFNHITLDSIRYLINTERGKTFFQNRQLQTIKEQLTICRQCFTSCRLQSHAIKTQASIKEKLRRATHEKTHYDVIRTMIECKELKDVDGLFSVINKSLHFFQSYGFKLIEYKVTANPLTGYSDIKLYLAHTPTSQIPHAPKLPLIVEVQIQSQEFRAQKKEEEKQNLQQQKKDIRARILKLCQDNGFSISLSGTSLTDFILDLTSTINSDKPFNHNLAINTFSNLSSSIHQQRDLIISHLRTHLILKPISDTTPKNYTNQTLIEIPDQFLQDLISACENFISVCQEGYDILTKAPTIVTTDTKSKIENHISTLLSN